ncbi:hypothetical protein [Prosthecomicrobium hirschii]|uniref:hypothetical protein n=1 Tax=Prosthecodimorpha hirschii TaxID=665126 RepID=UPI00221E601F|nr:hypothetical protein [Prosthecomicrobium hirschii]MCW1838867.1 hypothetical protein [Prosthecomicrobium hirschii]
MTAPAAFLAAIGAQADALAAGPCFRHDFGIGSAGIRVTVAARDAGQVIEALPETATDAPDWQLAAWDGNEPGRLPPPRPWGDTAHEPLGIVAAFSDETQRCAYDLHTQSLIVADLAGRRACTWYPQIATLPAWAKASPFRIPLSWALADRGLQMVHGAAVSWGGGAALLCGDGGSGKSTTALAAALAGFGYVGDDYCAVDSAALQVHMVYRTAKVLPSTLRLLPALGRWIVNPDRMAEEKGVIFLKPGQLDLVASAPLRCLILPSVADDGVAGLVGATPAEAIHALLPSTVGGLMGGTAGTPSHILRLARRLPVYRLRLAPDLARVVALLRDAIGEGP